MSRTPAPPKRSRPSAIRESRVGRTGYDAGWRPPETPLLGRIADEDLGSVLREAGYGRCRYDDGD